VNLTLALSSTLSQEDIGMLDADIFGPSILTMLNVSGNPELLLQRTKFKPLVNYNVKWYFQNVVTVFLDFSSSFYFNFF